MRKDVNIKRVITKVVSYALVLYVGGLVLREVGDIIVNSSNPLYQGFTIIGWNVTSTTNATVANCAQDACSTCTGAGYAYGSCVTDVSTGTGLLTVVGIIAFASIVLEFVQFKM